MMSAMLSTSSESKDMEKEFRDIIYVKAPIDELTKITKKCLCYMIPFSYDGGLELRIEPYQYQNCKPILDNEIAKVEKRCKDAGKVFSKEVYSNGLYED